MVTRMVRKIPVEQRMVMKTNKERRNTQWTTIVATMDMIALTMLITRVAVPTRNVWRKDHTNEKRN